MAIIKGETIVYSSKIEPRDSSIRGQNSLPACRLTNHRLSSQRVEIKDIKYNDDDDTKRFTADQYVFLVKCHNCNREWTELWRTSRWFIANNGNEYYHQEFHDNSM
jgi:hypothetical protein